MSRRASGLTLVEVLVSLAVLSVSVVFVSLLVSALGVNTSSANTLRVNQAAQAYLEDVQRLWRADAGPENAYGQLGAVTADAAPVPASLDRYAWTVTVCQLNAAFACTNTAQVSQAAGGRPRYTQNPAGVNLMRVSIRYTPVTTNGRSGAGITATAEVARP